MRTKDVARALKLTSQLMELHDLDSFKAKALASAAFRLEKTGITTEGVPLADLEKIEGIGKGVAAKIFELQSTGDLKELQQLLDQTPFGIIEILGIKGLGPKKVQVLWKELGIESVGELLYACHENRLTSLKGFGVKTQDQIKTSIEYSKANVGKFHYAAVEETAVRLVEHLKKELKTNMVSLTGDIRRRSLVIEKIEVLAASEKPLDLSSFAPFSAAQIELITTTPDNFSYDLLKSTGASQHLDQLKGLGLTEKSYSSEEEIYASLGLQYIEPELREGLNEVALAKSHLIPELIKYEDLKGILHNHTTYSDGLHTLRQMAEHCKSQGYEYLGICDHSQSAYYAKGLKVDRIIQQQEEIDQLNKELYPFRIFKGIESDILMDGSLDYPEEILKTFEFIVASIHANQKMDKAKATARLLGAIENPYTTILGHMSGRLLLSREGYPLDYEKIIDACAANGVIIELNSHPYRLDIDWKWIPYCLEKGVKISINPDAHHIEGLADMRYGVYAARKGMLSKAMCFNAMGREEMEIFFKNR